MIRPWRERRVKRPAEDKRRAYDRTIYHFPKGVHTSPQTYGDGPPRAVDRASGKAGMRTSRFYSPRPSKFERGKTVVW